MIIPAMVKYTQLRCPICGNINFHLKEIAHEETKLDANGTATELMYQYAESSLECQGCHHRFPYLGNGIDGFIIDDGTYSDMPEEDLELDQKTIVNFNPFYKSSDYK